MADLILILVAGFLGGLLNAIAGGGTFITFGAMSLAGVLQVIYGVKHGAESGLDGASVVTV